MTVCTDPFDRRTSNHWRDFTQKKTFYWIFLGDLFFLLNPLENKSTGGKAFRCLTLDNAFHCSVLLFWHTEDDSLFESYGNELRPSYRNILHFKAVLYIPTFSFSALTKQAASFASKKEKKPFNYFDNF